jgi:hypothetical protein
MYRLQRSATVGASFRRVAAVIIPGRNYTEAISIILVVSGLFCRDREPVVGGKIADLNSRGEACAQTGDGNGGVGVGGMR